MKSLFPCQILQVQVVPEPLAFFLFFLLHDGGMKQRSWREAGNAIFFYLLRVGYAPGTRRLRWLDGASGFRRENYGSSQLLKAVIRIFLHPAFIGAIE